jgi:hypothetical protein
MSQLGISSFAGCCWASTAWQEPDNRESRAAQYSSVDSLTLPPIREEFESQEMGYSNGHVKLSLSRRLTIFLRLEQSEKTETSREINEAGSVGN